jgi:hypothetical protein
MSSALLGFFYREKLINKNPFDSEGMLKMDFELRESEMSLEGRELFCSAVPKWWRKIDKGMEPANVHYLEAELTKIITSKSH